MSRSPILVLAVAAVTFAQYDDYPVGEYEYPHHRITVSPVTLIGGMDPAKRDEGPKVDLIWVPGITIQEMRYEYVSGPQGTFGWGPIGNMYLGLDSVKATSMAFGVFGRIYSGLGAESYVQMSAQYYLQTGTKLFDGGVRTIVDADGDSVGVAKGEVKVQGPQISPVLGYQKIFNRRWILEGQMGFTVGWYNIEYSGMPKKFTIARSQDEDDTETYESVSDWGGFYFVQVGVGYAF